MLIVMKGGVAKWMSNHLWSNGSFLFDLLEAYLYEEKFAIM